jgi:hypothetical protein
MQEQQPVVKLVHLEWCKVASRLVYPIMERSACDLGSSPSLRVYLFAVSEVVFVVWVDFSEGTPANPGE